LGNSFQVRPSRIRPVRFLNAPPHLLRGYIGQGLGGSSGISATLIPNFPYPRRLNRTGTWAGFTSEVRLLILV
jgi:hypothetical protein